MSIATFCGLAFEYQPGVVFRPRAASEELVDRAVRLIGPRAARIADVGTGAGAIAVAIAVNAPAATVYASDINPAAVELARANAAAHHVGHRVAVAPGSLLAGLPGNLDLVVANLPYLVDADEYPDEPVEAVAAGGRDGLDVIRSLLATVPAYLLPEGHVLIQYRGRVFHGVSGGVDRLLEQVELANPQPSPNNLHGQASAG